jgi:hypothetical protein
VKRGTTPTISTAIHGADCGSRNIVQCEIG